MSEEIRKAADVTGATVVVELAVQSFEHGWLTSIEEMKAILGNPSPETLRRIDEARERHVKRFRARTETEAGLR